MRARRIQTVSWARGNDPHRHYQERVHRREQSIPRERTQKKGKQKEKGGSRIQAAHSQACHKAWAWAWAWASFPPTRPHRRWARGDENWDGRLQDSLVLSRKFTNAACLARGPRARDSRDPWAVGRGPWAVGREPSTTNHQPPEIENQRWRWHSYIVEIDLVMCRRIWIGLSKAGALLAACITLNVLIGRP